MLNYTDSERKCLGVYYTPDNLSKVLCDWAIRTPKDKVLEPSFGGCGFLDASISRLAQLGNRFPVRNLYGADIDRRAFDFLYTKIGTPSQIKKRFILSDFIKLQAHDFKENEFDSIIGNPPYVSIHNMSSSQRESCKNIIKNSPLVGETLGSNTNLWAFFLVHSISFLKEGGRMGWVLPSSALHADYAKKLFSSLQNHFASFSLIKINERLFKSLGADEISVVLLADGFKSDKIKTKLSTYVVKSVKELSDLLKSPDWKSKGTCDYKHQIIGSKALKEYESLMESENSVKLGDFCRVLIGLVTGANSWFTLSHYEKTKLRIPNSQLKPIVTKFSHLKGLQHNLKMHSEIKGLTEKSFLLSPSSLRPGTAAHNYLSLIPDSDREKNRTFKKREKWYSPNDNKEPDAFLSYMFDKNARLVINVNNSVNCTNSIHRIYFNNGITERVRKAICVSFLSSFTRLSVELNGRSYGSGVQKLEPTAAKNVRLLINDTLVDELFSIWNEVDKLVQDKNFDAATQLVDSVIFSTIGLVSECTSSVLHEAADKLYLSRYESKVK